MNYNDDYDTLMEKFMQAGGSAQSITESHDFLMKCAKFLAQYHAKYITPSPKRGVMMLFAISAGLMGQLKGFITCGTTSKSDQLELLKIIQKDLQNVIKKMEESK